MVFIFLMGLLAIKAFINAAAFVEKIAHLCWIFAFGIFLYFLRPYLGFGFIAAFFGFGIVNFKTAPLKLYLILFLILFNLFFLFGFLEPILIYREAFDDILGGSNIGIQFKSPERFIPTFVLSFAYQILGLHFVNYSSIFAFVFESLPFVVVLIYLLKNRLASNCFVSYLVIFFVLYSTVWLLGNDNLGTAVRLRMYSYIAIFIAFMIVLQRKALLRKPN
ncbi:MAG: hypothetical protein H7240_01835 [Glaciimonas sp.]|nr:hypothetical protein [Glaciimonas sp.]